MKNIAKTTLLALLLGTGAFAAAGHHSGAEHGGDEVKHVGYSELGDPASVLEVISETSRALGQGEVRVTVLAAPINPSDLLQISGITGSILFCQRDPGVRVWGVSWRFLRTYRP